LLDRRSRGLASGPLAMTMPSHVIWHDVECASYDADLALWRELAAAEPGPILDVCAGTGRVALDLAAHGHDVVALDIDGELLAELERRARDAGVRVDTIVADAADFDAGPFALVAVPMQTVQLLPARAGFFASARRALAPGGLVALAIATDLESFEADVELPSPDVGVRDGTRFVSQPTAVRALPGATRIERLRHTIGPDGSRSTAHDVIELAAVSADGLAAEGAAVGLRPEPGRTIGPTDDHVGSEVVLLRG
jgi:SAM-dependent methyltransferase